MFRALIACVALAIAACASTPPSAALASNVAAQQPPCAPEATRLPQKGCGPGSTYDQTDISMTGKTDAAAAL